MNEVTSNEYAQNILRLREAETTLGEMCIKAFQQMEILCDELTSITKQHDLVIDHLIQTILTNK